MWPNFIIIGAPKSGTSTLFYVLAQHPQMYMCPVKEVGFFWSYAQNPAEEVQLCGPGTERLRHRLVNDLDCYQKLFDKVKKEKAIGEASVRYLASPRAPGLIHQFIPRAKLIVSLRQPADRAFSGFVHDLQDGVETCTDFTEAIAQEREGLRDNWTMSRHLARGFYTDSLKRYFEFFDRSQMHISLLDDLRDDAQGLFRSIFDFLDVDPDFVPDTSQRHNASGLILNPALRWLWRNSSKVRAAIRPLFSNQTRHVFSEWVMRDAKKPVFSPELRAELTEYYRQDIMALQDLIQRDLSHWLRT
jgi:hypothetical protein